MATEVAGTPVPAAWTERYAANLQALYARDVSLAAAVDALPFSRLPGLEPTRDGSATARVAADDGREIYLHSRYDPLGEAKKLIAANLGAGHSTFFLHGLGLGFALRALEEAVEQPVVLVVENDLRWIKATLLLHDLAEMIADGRLQFLTSVDKRDLSQRLSACNADLMLGVQSLSTPIAARVGAAFHEQARAALLDVLSVTKTHMVTLLKTSRATYENLSMNLGAYLRRPGVESLKDRAAGYPAIVVAAGPSLARNIDQLAALRERAVVISVQTVFKLLLARGVKPHFVTSLDYHDVSTEFFRDLADVGGATLVAEPKAAWRVIDLYPGDARLTHHRYFDALLGDAAPQRGVLQPGSTVAHLALYLAQHLGCDPIIFVGQDLAFSEGMFYLPGSPIEEIWRPELNRYQTIEMKQWERIVRNRPILRRVRDVHGRETYTDDLLFTYLEQFQNDFAATSRRIIQASEGGAALRGAEIMPLRDAAERYCTQPLPSDLLAGAATGGDAGDDSRGGAARSAERAAAQLDTRIKEIAEARDIAVKTRALLLQLSTLVEKPAEFNRIVAQVDVLRIAMTRCDAAYQLVCDVCATAQLRRYGADRRIGKTQRETPEIAARRIVRDGEFVGEFIEGCDFLLRVLPDSLQRLREGGA